MHAFLHFDYTVLAIKPSVIFQAHTHIQHDDNDVFEAMEKIHLRLRRDQKRKIIIALLTII